VGPFTRDERLTFRPDGQWPDPSGIGWTSSSAFNPTTIVEDDTLHLFYRSAPRKESMASRIGHATYRTATGWTDDPANPVLFPVDDDELLSVEDPKIYRADGRFHLFYNGIWEAAGEPEQDTYPSPGYPIERVGCDIKLAVSDDLVHWERVGRVVPHEVSRLWAKGAVIPRDRAGNAVRIDGEYLMFLSEGCGGRQTIGRSRDMRTWEFAPQDYLDLGPLGGSLYEVACAFADGDGRLVLDFFYADSHGDFAAAQALYRTDEPFRQLDLNLGGSLAWGGLTEFEGELYFAQGWDAPIDEREVSFYSAGAR
jgi:hypothetical protein